MRTFIVAAGVLGSMTAMAAPASAVRTWEGVSQGVFDDDTGELDYYTVRFTFDDSAARFITPLEAQDPEHTPYVRSYFENITSFSVTGVRNSMRFDSGTSHVSTLAPALAQYGTTPFLVLAGSDGTTPGYQMQFAYTPAAAYDDTAMPTALTIGAPGTDAGFNLLSYYYDGDPADEIIGGPDTILNFRFASGGFLPAAEATVPEPVTWMTMIAGFGLIGGALRRRRTKIAFA